MSHSNQDAATLKTEIEEVIAPHRSRTDQAPPFSGAELLVMANVCNDGGFQTRQEMYKWMLNTFEYYKAKALNAHLSTVSWYSEGMRFLHKIKTPDLVVDGLIAALDALEMPFERLDMQPGPFASLTSKFSVNEGEARIFLRGILEPKREGHFRFLELPAELRNNI